ncbi:MAG: ATP-binding cassette subfamily F protein 3 [Gammaproteobacteria bacterium]|jgi:ATP-binding cassette subfamily F protein 3
MLRLKSISLHRGPKRVLRDVSLTVHSGYKVGVVGANGAGKSSMLGMIAGRYSADVGEIERTAGQRVAEVMQDIDSVGRSLLDFVLDGNPELRALEAEIDASQSEGDGEQLGHLLARYEDLEGYNAESSAAKILSGLGFPADAHKHELGTFSGGWRVRAALARALAQPSDLLLLDEPTNHLDLDAVLWLEDWIKGYRGTLLLISHDREFLDSIVTHIVHVNAESATLYTGNYAAYERARAEALALQGRSYERQQEEIARIQKFVERFRYKATKARQAQSRLKSLERMEIIAPAHVDATVGFTIAEPQRLPRPLLRIDEASAGYGANVIVADIALTLVPGQRLGVLGRNGAGKSTVLKLIAGALAPLAGERDAHRDLRIGYFAQHQMEQLRDDESALGQIQRECKLNEQQGRNVLGRYGFSGDDAMRVVGTYSGGERARLVLAMIFEQRPNLLLLDEPTNHLDLDMRHALSIALQDFAGAIVLVSHDRHLLKTTVDELCLVRDGALSAYDGDLSDYARWLRKNQGRAVATLADASSPALHEDPNEAPGEGHSSTSLPVNKLRKLSYKDKRELELLPARIEELEQAQLALHEQLSDPAFYQSGGEKVSEVRGALSELEQSLEHAYQRWGELE